MAQINVKDKTARAIAAACGSTASEVKRVLRQGDTAHPCRR